MARGLARWSTVLAGVLGCAAGSGVVSSYAFGIFVKPIAQEFHWPRTAATLGISAYYLGAGVGAVALGMCCTRWGVKRPAAAFAAAFALLLMSVAFAPRSVAVFTVLFGAAGFVSGAASLLPYAVALAEWFDRRRGMALAIANSGTSIGGILMAPYAGWLLARYGWRGGYMGVGAAVGVVALIALLLFFRSPPRSAPKRRDEAPPEFRDGAFWMIGAPLFLISAALLGAITSLAPLLTDRGMSPAQSTQALGLLGAASLVSRLGAGLLLDRMHIRWVGGGLFACVGLGIVLLLTGGTGPQVWAAAACIGLGVGAEADLISYAASRYFPPERLARTLGAVWVFFPWGAGAGVMAASMSYDWSGSYQFALAGFCVMSLLAAGLISLLGPYRNGGPSAAAVTSGPPRAATKGSAS